ncbi:MAG: hypothetical protein Q8O67_03445 [Deltaproteobacteria bacterium]|nr:hypothetical protein [Deltaproteobacteria bacterium]
MRFAQLVVVAALALPLLGFSCAEGINPLFTPESLVVDDTLIGEFTSVEADKTASVSHLKIEKAKSGTLPAYVLTSWDSKTPKSKSRFRVVVTEIAGQRYWDVTAELTTDEAKRYAKDMSIPVHLYQKVEGTPEGFNLFMLDNEWLEAEGKKNPAMVLKVSDTTIIGLDTAGLRSLHERGAVAKAFKLSGTYVKKGAKAKDPK